MEEWFLGIDYWIFEKINHAGAFSLGDSFFPFITDLHKFKYFAFLVVPPLIFLFFRKFKKIGLLLFFNLLLAMGCNDFVGSVVKNAVLRPRPFQNSEISATQKSPAGSKSFYSNHASNMFTFATYTSRFFPTATIPLYTLAAVVCYSRVYNGVHYPSDVLAGALAGTFWGLLFSWLSRLMLKKLKLKNEVTK